MRRPAVFSMTVHHVATFDRGPRPIIITVGRDIRNRLIALARGLRRRAHRRGRRPHRAKEQASLLPSRLRRSRPVAAHHRRGRSEEHTSELQSLMRISYAVFCLKKKTHTYNIN